MRTLALTALPLVAPASAQSCTQRSLLSPRENAAVVHDPTRGRAVLFGGLESDLRALGDTWERDGGTWTPRFPATSPAPRSWYLGAPFVILPGSTNAAGFAHLDIALPLDNALAGAVLFGQAFTVDTTAPIGLSFTAAVRFTLGE
jgi:hypothetical protein